MSETLPIHKHKHVKKMSAREPTSDLDMASAFVARLRIAIDRHGGELCSVTFEGRTMTLRAHHHYGMMRTWKGRALSEHYGESAAGGIIKNVDDLAYYFAGKYLAKRHLKVAP